MLFSKEDSKNLAKIANALEQLTEAVMKDKGLEFFPNKEEAEKNATIKMHSSDFDSVVEEEFRLDRDRIIEKLKQQERDGSTAFFPEDGLDLDEIEILQND